ncbi:asparaginase [Kineococcus rubinsiae]|uniref:asparaginase n=1 Tax=Kineococcus rubinsiae TaxID=2609562 RepID=UPI0027E46FA7|nr:asparaginase [Kineococcus rubinsiae]
MTSAPPQPVPADPQPTPPPAHVPVADLVRGGLVESVHSGSMAVVGADGELLAAVGDVVSPVYPRSALKPLQAVAMVRAGLDLPPDLLALASASHSGSAVHLDGVRRILELAGCTTADLRNTPDLPFGAEERAAWTAAGGVAEPLTQNCSGKHAAMLLTCRAAGWDLAGYLDPEHPLQQAVAATVAELAGEEPAHRTTDGCGAPLFSLGLHALARAVGRIAGAAEGSAEGRVAHALRTHPELVAGEGRDVTALVRAVPGLLAKDGAEAVQIAGLPDGGALALKIADGSDRARLPVAVPGLERLGVDPGLLAPFASVAVLGGGHPVGELRGRPLPALQFR